jgi:hypothetical protein
MILIITCTSRVVVVWGQPITRRHRLCCASRRHSGDRHSVSRSCNDGEQCVCVCAAPRCMREGDNRVCHRRGRVQMFQAATLPFHAAVRARCGAAVMDVLTRANPAAKELAASLDVAASSNPGDILQRVPGDRGSTQRQRCGGCSIS